MFEQEPINLIAGAIFIIVSASTRFNTPATNRSSTTAFRYYFGMLIYGSVGLIFYFSLINSPHLVTLVLEDSKLPQSVQHLSLPLLVALLLTVLLPKVPVLSALDDKIRRALQAIARIPFEVRRWSAKLAKCRYIIAPDIQDALQAELHDHGIATANIIMSTARSPQALLAKASALMLALKGWEGEARYAGYLAGFDSDYTQLRVKYDRLVRRAKHYFRLMHELSGADATERDRRTIAAYQDDFEVQAEEHLQDLYDFISRGILHCNLTYSSRYESLKAMGFEVTLVQPGLSMNQLVCLFMAITFTLVLGFTFVELVQRQRPFDQIFLRSLMLSAMYVAAVFVAIYPKEKWRYTLRGPNDFRPFTFYFVAGLLAIAIVSPFNFGYRLYKAEGVWWVAWQEFARTYPYLLIPFAMAFTTAYLADNRPTGTWTRRRLRWIEGFLQSAVAIITTLFVCLWLTSTVGNEGPVPGLEFIGMSGVVGFLMGVLVPTWYRESPRQSRSCDIVPKDHGPSAEDQGLGLNMG